MTRDKLVQLLKSLKGKVIENVSVEVHSREDSYFDGLELTIDGKTIRFEGHSLDYGDDNGLWVGIDE
jgi:hypothetical protein